MTTYFDKTDSDSDRQQSSQWRLVPSYLTPVAVAPPSNDTNLFCLPYDRIETWQRPVLTWGTPAVEIRPEVHQTLLDQSLQEYGEIWRSLARR